MIKAIDIESRIEFISKNDVNDPKTIFILRPLSGIEMMNFTDGRKEDIINMIRSSMVEVRNYPLSGYSLEQIINSLSINVLGELINKINEINSLTEQDRKN